MPLFLGIQCRCIPPAICKVKDITSEFSASTWRRFVDVGRKWNWQHSLAKAIRSSIIASTFQSTGAFRSWWRKERGNQSQRAWYACHHGDLVMCMRITWAMQLRGPLLKGRKSLALSSVPCDITLSISGIWPSREIHLSGAKVSALSHRSLLVCRAKSET